jgi:AraC-like DNA-binding protein
MKCYAVTSGSCWVSVDGTPDAVLLETGDCILLPCGLAFCLATDLAGPRVAFSSDRANHGTPEAISPETTVAASILGGHFLLSDGHFRALLDSLPPIVHLRRAAHSKVIRWSLECLQEEVRVPKPGGSLIAQQLANIMLVQAIRIYLQEQGPFGSSWLSALSDPQMRSAVSLMHDNPGYAWTQQELADRVGMSRTVFAQKFRMKVAVTPIDYLIRWRMMIAADRLSSTQDSISQISSSLGYETESAFGRVYKKIWGCSLGKHRRLAPAHK